MRTLFGLKESPWTERARWALDHHGVTFRYHEHLPMLGELFLRRKARTKKASVPLLVDGRDVVMGSYEIAQHAERIGRGAALFPRGRDAEIASWNDLSDRMLRVGRAFRLRGLRTSREAQREALPGFVPGPLRGVMAPSAAMAARFLARKYDAPADVDAEVSHTLRPALEDVRAALAGKQHLLDGFTYADVAIATALTAVRPHESAPIGPGTRATWTNEELAREFDDLLLWRDAIYRKHR